MALLVTRPGQCFGTLAMLGVGVGGGAAPSPVLPAQGDSLALPSLGRGLVCPSAHGLEKRGEGQREERQRGGQWAGPAVSSPEAKGV